MDNSDMRTGVERIFIVDDNEVDQYLLNRIVVRSLPNAYVEKFSTAERFIEYLDQLIDREEDSKLYNTVVTMDLRMPGMGGLGALEEIQSRIDAKQLTSREIFLCVVLTSSNSQQDRVDIERFDFVKEYITKPLTAQKLEEIVAAYAA